MISEYIKEDINIALKNLDKVRIINIFNNFLTLDEDKEIILFVMLSLNNKIIDKMVLALMIIYDFKFKEMTAQQKKLNRLAHN